MTGGDRTITGIFQKGGRPSPNVPHFRYFQQGFKSKARIYKVLLTTSDNSSNSNNDNNNNDGNRTCHLLNMFSIGQASEY